MNWRKITSLSSILSHCTENQLVLHYGVCPNPIDTNTLLPFLKTYPRDLKIIVTDAGSGSEENLLHLDKITQLNMARLRGNKSAITNTRQKI